ncbi:MAG: Rieske (2Fe-2S) protein [Planctomycetes bacterium]|nr:Rieske (2Fe-2S) protein [Planctomycetota bacterium]
MAQAVKVGKSADVPEGGARAVEAAGRKIALFRIGGVLHAMDGVCPHRGGPLGEGAVENGIVSCPWHGWRFEVRTGKCVNLPGGGQSCFPVREEGGDIVVEV